MQLQQTHSSLSAAQKRNDEIEEEREVVVGAVKTELQTLQTQLQTAWKESEEQSRRHDELEKRILSCENDKKEQILLNQKSLQMLKQKEEVNEMLVLVYILA